MNWVQYDATSLLCAETGAEFNFADGKLYYRKTKAERFRELAEMTKHDWIRLANRLVG